MVVELRDEISERAIGEAKALGDIEQRLLVDNDGADGFIAFLLSLTGLEKELLATGIIHDRASKMSYRKTATSRLRDTRNCR